MSDPGSPSSRDAEDSALSFPDQSAPESPETSEQAADHAEEGK